MKLIDVSISGKTPLLCNKFTDHAMTSNGVSGTFKGDKGTPMEQAEAKLYIGIDGTKMIPQPNLFRSIIDAGKYFKHGKSKITTQKSSLIPACVGIHGVEIPIIHKEPWTVDTRAVVVPSTGGRIVCHRPCFHDWRLDFVIELDESMLPVKVLRDIVDAAGRQIGLGDFRPDRKGPFGKFVVVSWQEQSVEKAG